MRADTGETAEPMPGGYPDFVLEDDALGGDDAELPVDLQLPEVVVRALQVSILVHVSFPQTLQAPSVYCVHTRAVEVVRYGYVSVLWHSQRGRHEHVIRRVSSPLVLHHSC